MDFRILGPLELRDGGRPLVLGGERQRAVLAILLLHRNEVVSADRLIDELWGEAPPAGARQTVRAYNMSPSCAARWLPTAPRLRTRGCRARDGWRGAVDERARLRARGVAG